MIKRIFIGFLLVGAISMIVMSFHYFINEQTGIMKGKEVSAFLWYRVILRIHILGGIMAITLGPLQFIENLRLRRPTMHRKMGYIYVSSIMISSVAGLVVAQFAIGGLISTLGFSCLALVWGYTTFEAVSSARSKKIRRHKLFMMLSFGLTFSAIPQRTMLLTALFTDISFIEVYRASAWFSWMFNLVLAYSIFSYTEKKLKNHV